MQSVYSRMNYNDDDLEELKKFMASTGKLQIMNCFLYFMYGL